MNGRCGMRLEYAYEFMSHTGHHIIAYLSSASSSSTTILRSISWTFDFQVLFHYFHYCQPGLAISEATRGKIIINKNIYKKERN